MEAIAISIHALREEGDLTIPWYLRGEMDFYPRPPRGGRPPPSLLLSASRIFLSTPSARRATRSHKRYPCPEQNFYPRPPRGGRLSTKGIPAAAFRFLSTPSARRATHRDGYLRRTKLYFYPRPPRGGRRVRLQDYQLGGDFYPRPPRGGRLMCAVLWPSTSRFLSTPSARRATYFRVVFLRLSTISIHALREEGDSKNRDKISIFKQIIQHSARI